MNAAALHALLLAAIGLPVTVGGVALFARALVYRHADATADAIRKQHPQPIPVPVQTRPRQKELTHR